jgi:asparagine synthase
MTSLPSAMTPVTRIGPAMPSTGLPLACGALGRADDAAIQRMCKALGDDLSEVHRDRDAVLYLDREPLRWGADGRRGFAWSESLPVPSTRPASWREVSTEWSACGLAFEAGRWLLHASISGLGPLYYLPIGQATYFSSRVDALVAATPDRLTIDWDAWAAILSIGYPIGPRTPFSEIKRLEPSAYLKRSPRGTEVGSLGWTWGQIEPSPGAGPENIVDALREQLSRLPADEPVHSLLSGGWDSRLLLTLTTENRDRGVSAWTVNSDRGHANEERIAGLVAGELGVDHEVITPEVGNFWEDWKETAARQDYQAPLRLPLLRLARVLQGHPGIAVDGIAGDIFIKGLFVNRPMLEASTWEESVDRLWRRVFLLRDGLALLERGFRNRTVEIARSGFTGEVERFRGHPAGATLAIFWLRTRRSISAGPLELLGSHVPVSTPFTCDAVVREALAVEPREKLGGAFYRRVWDLADPKIAALPSTNDPEYDPGPRESRRLALSGKAVQAYGEMLADNPLRPLFSPRLQADIEGGRIRRYLRHRQKLHALDSLCRFGLWHERYRGRLLPLDLDEFRGEKRPGGHRSALAPVQRRAIQAAGRAARDAADAPLAQADRLRRRAGIRAGGPITAYDHLTAPQIKSRLGDLGAGELRKLRRREKRGKARKSVLEAIDRQLK